MSLESKIKARRIRRANRVRSVIRKKTSVEGVLRVAVFRSLKHIYAQAIDDVNGHTVASCSSHEFELKGTKSNAAELVGSTLAQKLRAQNILTIVFDRNKYLYHGRVKALAEGLRSGGINF